ncbi:uncharacterized protein LOC133321661 [Musca vetustissima]|uniref:uncharacterized protein LOC133321661 n=1 Tax=Musca vetustissima TaxID=27455 RepID=UPI002AB7579E|nr:uncharacterized protein LOC133321661 [Musca vetustissima]
MRTFIVLCFVALCSASLEGYNYPSQANGPSVGTISGISKRFFIHSAPEEEGVEVHQHDIAVGTPRKNLNVVFVKAPAEKQQKIQVRITPAVNEEKTAVYVLSKKADAPIVESIVQEPVTTTSKPEVAFIKYRTNEEAEHAQRHILAEYDRLGGTTSVSDEGVALVKSVIGLFDTLQQSGQEKSDAAPTGEYLPPTESH